MRLWRLKQRPGVAARELERMLDWTVLEDPARQWARRRERELRWAAYRRAAAEGRV